MENMAKEPPSASEAGKGTDRSSLVAPPTSPTHNHTTNKMADMKNKFMSWTLNVIKETAATPSPPPSPLYGIGVELVLTQPRLADRPPRKDGGVPLQRKHQVIMIASLHPSGPAAKMGLQKGDVVLQVDDTQLDYGQRVYTPPDVAQLVRGPEGTFVDVTVERREGGEMIQKEFHLRRDPIVGIRGRRMLKSNGAGTPCVSANGVDGADAGATQNKDASTTTAAGGEGTKTASNHTVKRNERKNSGAKVPTPNMLDRLDSVLSEEKEEGDGKIKGLFPGDDDEQSPLSSEEASEEKTQDDNDISSNTDNVSDQWEVISERSGSALVISISSGSASHFLRCTSPSLLKNKFVLTEYTAESSHLEHIVLPTDTLQGLCLAYKVSATQLRMENKFSGNSLQMAPKKIKIPVNGVTKGMMIKTQDKTSKEFKLYAFVAEIPTMELVEAKVYLDLSNWDLAEALRSAREDIDYGWDYYNSGSGAESPALPMFASSVAAKPKDLTAQDIYDGAPAFEGDGVELKDIPKGNGR
ncbi:hypothetical protein ACHAWT_010463 [Skeletonema menzelii]